MNDPQTTGCMPLARVPDEPPSDGSIGSIGRRILQNAVRQSASAS